MNDIDNKPIYFIVGAGISISQPACVPLWNNIKNATINDILNTVIKYDQTIWRNGDRYPFVELKDTLNELLKFPEITMEIFSRAYRRDILFKKLDEIITSDDRKPNFNHIAIAKLAKIGKVKGIITTNFDTLLEKAFDQENVEYTVIFNEDIKTNNSENVCIYKLHGTIDKMITMSFTYGDYFKGINNCLKNYLLKDISDVNICVIGYSGFDIDVFPLISECIRNNANSTYVIDIKKQSENTQFLDLGKYIQYKQLGASEYLASLVGINYENSYHEINTACSLLPNDKIFNMVLFIAESILFLEHDKCVPVCFLCKDIAEDNHDPFEIAIAHYISSISLVFIGENNWAASEFEMGHKYFSEVDFERMEYEEHQPQDYFNHITFWHQRAEAMLAFAALNVIKKNKNKDEVKNMENNLFFFHKNGVYDHWKNQFHGDYRYCETALYPEAIHRLIEGYRLYIKKDPEWKKCLSDCIDYCKQHGFYRELIQASYLLGKFSFNKFDDIKDYICYLEKVGINIDSFLKIFNLSNSFFIPRIYF